MKNDKISLYPQTGKLFDDTYNKEEILSQYFVTLKSDNEISLNEDKDEVKKLIKTKNIKTKEKENCYFDNNLRYLQKKSLHDDSEFN